MKSIKHELGTALITGASEGIGAIYADRLAQRGYDLILVARNQHKLQQVAKGLQEKTGRTVEIVAADLTDTQGLQTVEQILQQRADICLLVNNAGIAASDHVENFDFQAKQKMIDLNISALTRLTYAIIPAFKARGQGTIMNIASVLALHPALFDGVYAATKAYVLAFSQALQQQLKADGIDVQVVLPGATATNFWQAAGTSLSALPQEMVMAADEMVDAALAGYDLGETVTIPSLPDIADWEAFEAARVKLLPNLSRQAAAPRYVVQQSIAES